MENQTSVFVALVGKPNVGKSTLMNRLIGAKVAIVSPKPQTTRTRIMGVVTEGGCQFVFEDTPGFHKPNNRLGEKMVQSVTDTVGEVDAALFLTYPKDFFDEIEQSLLASLRDAGIPVILVINKVDTAKSDSAVKRSAEKLSGLFDFDTVCETSAARGDGCDNLLDLLRGYASEGPHYFPDDTLTDQPEKVIAAEIIREKLLDGLFDELPHGCGVSVESFKERDNSALIDIDAIIFCEKDSHKGMIIGKGGSKLKQIGTAARLDIEKFLGARVNLQLHVKVKEDWRNSEFLIKYLGY